MSPVFDALRIKLFFIAGSALQLFFPSYLFSQNIKEITVEESGITYILKHYPDSLAEDVERNTTLFCCDDSAETFWYKIYIHKDCKVSFDIFPSGIDNIYNYELYSKANNLTPQDVAYNNIEPIRKNFYRDAMYITGIGLSTRACESSTVFPISDSSKYIYHTSYHDAVCPKKGDVLLLRIFHVKGTDCGHYFVLNINNNFRKFQSIHKSCYLEKIKATKVRYYVFRAPATPLIKADDLFAHTINQNRLTPSYIDSNINAAVRTGKQKVTTAGENSGIKTKIISQDSIKHNTNERDDKKIKPDNFVFFPEKQKINYSEDTSVVKAEFIIKDSITHNIVEADIKELKHKNPDSIIVSAENGRYKLTLKKNIKYNFEFSSVGYKSKELFFVTTDTLFIFSRDIYLIPCKEGENFIMDKIYFYPNSYNMKPEGNVELDKLAKYLKNNSKTCIEIQGHTNGNKRIKRSYESDFKGSSKKLSQGRANIIKKYLIDKGIEDHRLIANGYGGKKMIFSDPRNQTQANKNIRVEIRILSQKDTILTK